jgi:hypothetical protein
MRRVTVLRWLASLQFALLPATWLVPSHVDGPCPHARGHAGAPADAHSAHAGTLPDDGPASPPTGDCDCVGQCCAARAPLLPVGAPADLSAAETVVQWAPRAPRVRPRAAFHLELLPFSTAPPIA